jgi:hypothetical protein
MAATTRLSFVVNFGEAGPLLTLASVSRPGRRRRLSRPTGCASSAGDVGSWTSA